MALEESAKDDDKVFELDGYKVVISKDYEPFYKNLTIDWVDHRASRGFKVYDSRNSSSC
ncbi:MAG: hypothetical protein ACYC21_04140 [Eubacteriales bacterium]